MTTPGAGPSPTPPPQGPQGPQGPSTPPPSSQPAQQTDQQDAALLNSPFAKMFAATGTMPTAKEMQAIINGILNQVVAQVKQDDAQWKKAMEKLKKQLEGKDN